MSAIKRQIYLHPFLYGDIIYLPMSQNEKSFTKRCFDIIYDLADILQILSECNLFAYHKINILQIFVVIIYL